MNFFRSASDKDSESVQHNSDDENNHLDPGRQVT